MQLGYMVVGTPGGTRQLIDSESSNRKVPLKMPLKGTLKVLLEGTLEGHQ